MDECFSFFFFLYCSVDRVLGRAAKWKSSPKGRVLLVEDMKARVGGREEKVALDKSGVSGCMRMEGN